MGRPRWPHPAACGKQVRWWRQQHHVRCPLQLPTLPRPIRMHMQPEVPSPCDAARRPIGRRQRLQQGLDGLGHWALIAARGASHRLQQLRGGHTRLLGITSSSLPPRHPVDLAAPPRPTQSAHPSGGLPALPGLRQCPRGTPWRRAGSGLWGHRCVARVPHHRLMQVVWLARCHQGLLLALVHQGLVAREHHRSHQSAAGCLPRRVSPQQQQLLLAWRCGDPAVPPRQGCMVPAAQAPQFQLLGAAPHLQCSYAHPAGVVLLRGVHQPGVQTQRWRLPRHLRERHCHQDRKNGHFAHLAESQGEAKRPLSWPAQQMPSFSGRWMRFGANSWSSVCLDLRRSG
mmetsp:Transcript_14577/g.28714  ORF Transcript_14577/g.28714 Transcript_14577/m.28714 type:complete len:342 (-) Transcript_14577:443-1468(-)